MDVIQDNYNQLLKQNEVLRQENEELKSLLHAHGIEYKPKLAEKKRHSVFIYYLTSSQTFH